MASSVTDPDDLVTRLRGARFDQPTPLGVLRGARVEMLAVTLAERPRG